MTRQRANRVGSGPLGLTPVLAHVGHWYAELLYVAPVAAVGLWFAVANLRDRRRAARASADRTS